MQRKNFIGLNYSLGNEDLYVDATIVPESSSHVMIVAASGANIVPFLAKQPHKLSLVDISSKQLIISELRYRTLCALSYEEFLRFWGYPPYHNSDHSNFRKSVVANLHMSSRAAHDAVNALLHAHAYQSPLYLGKWERTVTKLSALYRLIVGKKALDVFNCASLEDQQIFLASHFPHKRLSIAIFCAASLATLVKLMRKNDVPPQAQSSSFFAEYSRIFSDMFSNTYARENYFLQLVLLGKIMHSDAYPPEAQEDVFLQAKAWSAHCAIDFVCSNIIDHAANSKIPIDYVGLSNIVSYFEQPLKMDYLQRIALKLNTNALVFSRMFLSGAHDVNADGYVDVCSTMANVFAQERTKIYSMRLYKKC